ncbi:MAG: hypothetical protein U5R14_00675 [Gemmatimonadota bacterium]|nr:hypothetical protein [Gemmatimonadota bacterium]
MSSEPLISSIDAEVSGLVRDLEPEELSIRLLSREELPVRVVVRHDARLAVSSRREPGPLPEDVRDVGTPEELQSALQARLREAEEQVGPRLDTWVAEEAADYRARPTPEDCLAEQPALGSQEVCDSCAGRGEVACGSCAGNGWTTCQVCEGRGRNPCDACGGAATLECSSCDGSGEETRVSHPERFDGTKWVKERVVERVPCTTCGGSGSVACHCGDGWLTCTDCDDGRVECGICGGSGAVACEPCDATGAVHSHGRVECSVERDVEVEVESDDDRDRETLVDEVPFDELGRLAGGDYGVRLDRVRREGPRAILAYVASVPVEVGEADLGARAIRVRAYGPGREVFDYQNLVGSLLEPDLARLESCLRTRGRGRRGRSLLEATRRFFSSELNDRIAEAPPRAVHRLLEGRESGRSGGVFRKALERAPGLFDAGSTDAGEASRSLLERCLEVGMITPAYLERASAAVGKALPRLYRPLVLPGLLAIVAGAVGVLFLVGRVRPEGSALSAVVPVVALAGASWWLVEHRARASLRAMFGPGLLTRLAGPLARARNRYRLGLGAGIALATLVGGWIL